jgi:hypothetical protein
MYRTMLDAFSRGLRVAAPGIVQSFNPTTQTLTARIAIREQLKINGNLSWVDIPLLVDVPIVVVGSGDYMCVPSIKKGDECLIIFGDNCMDAWWQSGGIQNQAEIRRHDLSDGFAIVGLWSQPKKISDYPTNGIQLRNRSGNVKVELSGTTINIQTGGQVNVNGGTVVLAGGGPAVARVGDSIVGTCPHGAVTGTISSGSGKVTSG